MLGLTTGVGKSRNPSPNPDVTIRTIGRRCVTNAKHLRLETKSYTSQRMSWMIHTGCNIQGLHKQTNKQTWNTFFLCVTFWIWRLGETMKKKKLMIFKWNFPVNTMTWIFKEDQITQFGQNKYVATRMHHFLWNIVSVQASFVQAADTTFSSFITRWPIA